MCYQLTASGWKHQDKGSFNLPANIGIAIREFQTNTEPAKIFVDRAAGSESGTILPRINRKELNECLFSLCTHEERYQIVQEIESRLSVCDKIEETITTSLKQAEALRQSILKQAFEGRLHMSFVAN
ncbi:MAG: hypothetical protein EOO46_13620 [Flavobacterium sp.]|nr:MAG: hypothetical protein EOO46_13620 [Flavobacterium sp.]